MDVAHCYLEGDAEVVEFCLHDGYQQVLAASTYTLQEESKIEKLQGWKAHDFELWTTCFDIHQPQLILEQNNGSYYDILEKRLEQVPGGVENKRNVYIAKSSPPNVSKAYFEQFRDDFLRVLRFRSEEMITGGRILLLTSL
ncbi:hypothetical protein V6Z11_D07G149200 [Gossypium hirsutum]